MGHPAMTDSVRPSRNPEFSPEDAEEISRLEALAAERPREALEHAVRFGMVLAARSPIASETANNELLIADLQAQADIWTWLVNHPYDGLLLFSEATNCDTYGLPREEAPIPAAKVREFVRERVIELMEEVPTDGDIVRIRKWDTKPFPEGNAYSLSSLAKQEPLAWAVFASDTHELLSVEIVKPDESDGDYKPEYVEPLFTSYAPSVAARQDSPAQQVPEGMYYFSFYCEDYDAVQRVRVGADAPRQFTCGVTGISKSAGVPAAKAMPDSPTPRTDADEFEVKEYDSIGRSRRFKVVGSDKARQLERELADANSAAAHYVRDEPNITPRRALVRQAVEIERLKGELDGANGLLGAVNNALRHQASLLSAKDRELSEMTAAADLTGKLRELERSSAATEMPEPLFTPAEEIELHKAFMVLSAALGHPAMDAEGDQTIESQLVRFAATKFASSASTHNEITCPACKGSGGVKTMTHGLGPDDHEVDVQCEKCGGTGAIAPATTRNEIQDGEASAPTSAGKTSEIKPDGNADAGRSGAVGEEGGERPGSARSDAVFAGGAERGPRPAGGAADQEERLTQTRGESPAAVSSPTTWRSDLITALERIEQEAGRIYRSRARGVGSVYLNDLHFRCEEALKLARSAPAPTSERADFLAELLWQLYEGIYGHRKAEGIDPFKTALGGALELAKAWRERGQPAEARNAALEQQANEDRNLLASVMGERDDLARAHAASAPAPTTICIDLDAEAWKIIKEAAAASTWMPPEYMQNDWVIDVCRLLREGVPSAPAPTTATKGPFALPVEAIEITSEKVQPEYNFGWCVADATKRVIAPYLNKAQAEALTAALNASTPSARAMPHFIGLDMGKPGGDFTGYACICGKVRVSTDGPCEQKNCPIPVLLHPVDIREASK